MNTDSVLRVIILCMCVIEIFLVALWLRPRLKYHVLPWGEVLARSGGVVLVGAILYGTIEVLFGWTSTWRLPLIIIGLSWLIIGLIASLTNDYRNRKHHIARPSFDAEWNPHDGP